MTRVQSVLGYDYEHVGGIGVAGQRAAHGEDAGRWSEREVAAIVALGNGVHKTGIDGGPQLGGEIEEKELIGAEGSKKGVLVTHKDHVPVHQTEDVPSPQSPDCNVDVPGGAAIELDHHRATVQRAILIGDHHTTAAEGTRVLHRAGGVEATPSH